MYYFSAWPLYTHLHGHVTLMTGLYLAHTSQPIVAVHPMINACLAFCCQLSQRLLAPWSGVVALCINYSIKLAFGPLTVLSPRKLTLKIWFQTQCQSQQVKLHCSENRVASAVFDSLTHSRALRENSGSPSHKVSCCAPLCLDVAHLVNRPHDVRSHSYH